MKHGFASSLRLRPSIILFGDSITEFGFGRANDSADIGWAGLLASAYTRRCDVLNRGFSGYNTRHALDVLPRVFGDLANDATTEIPRTPTSHHELLFCTVFFGANDAALPGEPQHVPIEEYQANLNNIVQEIRRRSSDDLPLILMTPPPVDEAAWASRFQVDTSDRSNEISRLYGERVKEVARAHNHCSFLDTWKLLRGDQNDHGQFLSDGLHLNEAGNRLIFGGLMEVLRTDFQYLTPMSDEDGEGRYGSVGINKEEKLWRELC
jgi:isoamyl acetate esterase